MAIGSGEKAFVNLHVAAEVDEYFHQHLLTEDQLMDEVLQRSLAQPIPKVQVSPTHGKLLKLLVQMTGAKRVLEVGTLAAYSTIWMAQGLPEGGQIITLDFDEKHVAVARDNIAFAGMSDRIEVIQGPAVETMQQMIAEQVAPFDFIFLDADKGSNPEYLELSIQLSRPGTIIIGDNVVRHAKILNPRDKGKNIKGLRQFFEIMQGHPRLDTTAIQTVGEKGWDGLTISRVR